MRESPLIVALDQDDPREARALVEKLGERVGFYKIHGPLYLREGLAFIEFLKSRGKRIFLDLKFHDIPNTVGKACKGASELGIDLLTVHLSGGSEMLDYAVKAVAGTKTRILGVSVLTSMNETALREETGVTRPLRDQVEHLVGLGLKAGVHGIVSSPEETRGLRQKFGTDFLIVNPGIRGSEDSKGDQKRTATPKAAMENGASYLVVGRPIIAAPDPLAAADKILDEIDG